MTSSASPAVSVVMAAYNLEKFVGETIESVLRQTYADFEFIIIDNGSKDKTADIIRAYSDPRIKLLSEPINLGPSLAVNRAIEQSRGEYLALLAADDLWAPEKLARQIAFMNDHAETGAVFTTAQPIDEKGCAFGDATHFYFRIFEQPNRSRHEWLRHFFQNGNCLCAVSSFVRRSVVSGDWYRPEMLQLSDFELWIRILLGSGIHVIQEKLTYFRIRSGDTNTSGARLDVSMRSTFETATRIAALFVQPAALDEIHLIFPEIGALTAGRSNRVKKWHLAGLFAEHSWESFRLFGLMLQSDLLADATSREELMSALGPSVLSRHFHAVGVASPIGIPSCRAQIYWPLNGEFAESRSSSQSYEDGVLARMAFTIPIREGESTLRFDPCDGMGMIWLKEIRIRSGADGGTVMALTNGDLLSHEGCVRLDSEQLHFATTWNPRLVFRLPAGIGDKKVKVEAVLLHSNSTGALQDALTSVRDERDNLRTAIKQYNSRSWLHRAFHKVRFRPEKRKDA